MFNSYVKLPEGIWEIYGKNQGINPEDLGTGPGIDGT